jgi:hypothetical protein
VSQIDLTARDARVLELLRTELAAFDLELTGTEAVVKRVSELIGAFEDVDVTFVEQLRQVWWPVEFAFALSVDQERSLTSEEAEQMRAAIIELEELIGPAVA